MTRDTIRIVDEESAEEARTLLEEYIDEAQGSPWHYAKVDLEMREMFRPQRSDDERR